MDAQMIREDIRDLIENGRTTYENCEKLVLLKKTLKCLAEESEAAAYMDDASEDRGGGPLTKAQIMGWVSSMENADGTTGGHWTMEQTEQVRKQQNIECDPVMFYATVNMMYSDYCKAAEKANANNPAFYACMAKAFLDDKDAMPHKLARYYHYIVEK